MKKEEVPQDEDNINQGLLTKLYYATDEQGHYGTQNSIGWETETIVTRQAWDLVYEQVESARQKVLSGEASPILYFKEKNIMTYAIVAGYIGSFSWMVWLHTKPFFFKRLSRNTLKKYAYAFRTTVDEILDIEKLKTTNASSK